MTTQRHNPGNVPHSDGRLVSENSGQFGVSDARRAELSQMEQDAGVQHEAADESVPQQPARDSETESPLAQEDKASRPGDRH